MDFCMLVATYALKLMHTHLGTGTHTRVGSQAHTPVGTHTYGHTCAQKHTRGHSRAWVLNTHDTHLPRQSHVHMQLYTHIHTWALAVYIPRMSGFKIDSPICLARFQ